MSQEKKNVNDKVPDLEENAVMTNLLHQCAAIGGASPPPDGQNQSSGQGSGSGRSQQLSQEDKEFLEGAIRSCTTKSEGHHSTSTNPIQRLVALVDSLWGTGNGNSGAGGGIPSAEHFEALSTLEELTEDMNRGDDFLRANGLQLCFKLLNVSNDAFRTTACNLIANTSLNNPLFHQNPLSHGIVLQLFSLYEDKTTKWKVRLKYLHAVSCIFAGNEQGVRHFLMDPCLGQGLLYKHYFSVLDVKDDKEHHRLQQRLGSILEKVYAYVDDTRILKPIETESFVNDLLAQWFENNGQLIWTNLNVLLSIISGKNSGLARAIVSKQEKRIGEIMDQMKKSKDVEENLELLRTFEQKFDEIKNKKILSICG